MGAGRILEMENQHAMPDGVQDGTARRVQVHPGSDEARQTIVDLKTVSRGQTLQGPCIVDLVREGQR